MLTIAPSMSTTAWKTDPSPSPTISNHELSGIFQPPSGISSSLISTFTHLSLLLSSPHSGRLTKVQDGSHFFPVSLQHWESLNDCPSSVTVLTSLSPSRNWELLIVWILNGSFQLMIDAPLPNFPVLFFHVLFIALSPI